MYKVIEKVDNSGLALKGDNFVVVKKEGKKGDLIPRHNHPEANVLFTVVKGNILVTLNDEEKINLIPGQILNFDGNNHISAELLDDSEAYVTLITK